MKFRTTFTFEGTEANLDARRAIKQYTRLGFKDIETTASGEFLSGIFPVILEGNPVASTGKSLVHVVIDEESGKQQALGITAESILTVSLVMEGDPIEDVE